MKRILFLASHLYSGSQALYHALDEHPRIQGYEREGMNIYDNPSSLVGLTEMPNKISSRAAIYMDHLLFNPSLSTKAAYQHCHFVYVVRPARPTLNFLVANRKYRPGHACRYYCYRLRRLCEMAKRTPGAVLLTWDDLTSRRGLPLVEEYLRLNRKLELSETVLATLERQFVTDLLAYPLLEAAESSYERHLFFLKNQQLKYWR